MTVEKRDCLAPSAIEKPQGDLGMDISGAGRQSTRGALGDETAHGDLAGYRQKQADYGAVHPGGSAGFGVGQPCELSRTGEVDADSNLQSTGTAGGPLADQSFVVREGGSDASAQEAQGFGGRTIA
jgi:hypothetical protein